VAEAETAAEDKRLGAFKLPEDRSVAGAETPAEETRVDAFKLSED
jgi:hypothetical protein